jgi:hypothetical protein
MIPQRLFLSMASYRARLNGRASARSGQAKQRSAGERFFRPQIALLEDRCLPATMYSLAGDTAILNRPVLTGTLSSIVRELAESYAQSAPHQQLIVVYGLDSLGQMGMPTGTAWITWGADSNSIRVDFTSGFDQPMGPQSPGTSPSAPMVIVVTPPSNSSTPPRMPPSQDPGHTVSWWSQTPHPGVGALLVLPASSQTVSALPAGQSSTPVMLFLPQQATIVGELKPAHTIAGPAGPIYSLDALASIAAPVVANSSRDVAEVILSCACAPKLPGPEYVLPGEGVGFTPPPLRPEADEPASRDELVAMTNKILQEALVANESEQEEGPTFSGVVKAVAACAAVQSMWLGFRHLASIRTQELTGLRAEHSSWIWRRSKHFKQPAPGDIPESAPTGH